MKELITVEMIERMKEMAPGSITHIYIDGSRWLWFEKLYNNKCLIELHEVNGGVSDTLCDSATLIILENGSFRFL